MVSSRHTHTIYYVDGRTKKVLWQLGGEIVAFQATVTELHGSTMRVMWEKKE